MTVIANATLSDQPTGDEAYRPLMAFPTDRRQR